MIETGKTNVNILSRRKNLRTLALVTAVTEVGKKNQSRESHVQLDGTIIPLDEEFEILGSGERCMFPRDTKLSPKERVNCHCAVGPVVDPVILGLSAEEKESMRILK